MTELKLFQATMGMHIRDDIMIDARRATRRDLVNLPLWLSTAVLTRMWPPRCRRRIVVRMPV